VAFSEERLGRGVRVMVGNAGSLVATTAVTSVFGFVYWLVAARLFPPASVGLAASAITSMTLLSTVAVLGLGTLLVREFPRKPEMVGTLMMTALSTAAASGIFLGLNFILIAPHLFRELAELGARHEIIFLFAAGVAMTAVSQVFDAAVIGLLRGGLQLMRNSLFAATKLVALVLVATWTHHTGWTMVFLTWVLGIAISLATVASLGPATGRFGLMHRPRWGALRGLRLSALSHHSVNLGLQAPAMALPLMATITLSASKTASFYVAWQVAAFVFVTPIALSMALYAVGSSKTGNLLRNLRFSFGLAMASGAGATLVLWLLANKLLSIFGAAYTQEPPLVLRILCLAVFPMIVKDFYIALCRIHGSLRNPAVLLALGAVGGLAMATVGGRFGGLAGFSVGVVLGEFGVAAFAIPTLARALTSRPAQDQAPGPEAAAPAAADSSAMAVREEARR
jgi:O-antigen/teichoic acid export membrane protein